MGKRSSPRGAGAEKKAARRTQWRVPGITERVYITALAVELKADVGSWKFGAIFRKSAIRNPQSAIFLGAESASQTQ
jgi:hypothetical protein